MFSLSAVSLEALALNNQQMLLVDSRNPHLAVLLLSHLSFWGKSQDSSSSLLLVHPKEHSPIPAPLSVLHGRLIPV